MLSTAADALSACLLDAISFINIECAGVLAYRRDNTEKWRFKGIQKLLFSIKISHATPERKS